MQETSGVLAPVVKKLLENGDLDEWEVLTLRAYFRQWVDSPVWDLNPHAGPEVVRELADLRAGVRKIETFGDIAPWLAAAIRLGMDPL
jgi:hypothetical protein